MHSMIITCTCGIYLSYSDKGKKTREYVTLQENLSCVVNTLRSVPGSKGHLRLKFIEEDWLDKLEDPPASELVTLVLNRIEADSRTFYKFVMMLCDISGMDLVAKQLTTKLQDWRS